MFWIDTLLSTLVGMTSVNFWSKLLASLMRSYFPKRTSGTQLHTLSKLYDVPVVLYSPSFEIEYCYICGVYKIKSLKFNNLPLKFKK